MSGYVKLRFYGFTADHSICLQQTLPTLQQNCLNSGNIYYGRITEDEDGVSLHDLLANVPETDLQEWTLEPQKYKETDEQYVSYQLTATMQLRPKLLNPSPPA